MCDPRSFVDSHGPFVRRCQFIRAGYRDAELRRALDDRRLLRVRHGWYAAPDTASLALRAVRVGGRVTGVSALRSYGLFLPRSDRLEVAVPRNAAALRRPGASRERLTCSDLVRVFWIDARRGELDPASWRVSTHEALDRLLHSAPRELAVAACDGLVRYRGWGDRELDAAFARAPMRVQPWRQLVDGRADSWGETVVRLRLRDAGFEFEPQAAVPGAGRLDGRIGPRTYVEVDGAQHEEAWSVDDGDWYSRDRERDAIVAAYGGRVLRITYPMFTDQWELFLDGARRAVALDVDNLARRGLAA